MASLWDGCDNYAKYLDECLDSVANQDYPAYEIILVDDGSTDDSLETAQNHFTNVICISQENQGQLAAIKTATEAATGDVLCFLDSDDKLKSNYLKKLKDAYQSSLAPDFAYVGLETFGTSHEAIRYCDFSKDTLVPSSRQILMSRRLFLGAPTSGNSIKAHFAKSLFKIVTPQQIEDYRTCADNVLVYGASLIGCRKLQLRELLVDYRTHGNNNYHGTNQNKIADRLKRIKLINELAESLDLKFDIDKLYDEFKEQLKYTSERSDLIRAYLKAPKKLKMPYWRLQFWVYYVVSQ